VVQQQLLPVGESGSATASSSGREWFSNSFFQWVLVLQQEQLQHRFKELFKEL
jgi:hypothetical protein